MLQNVFLSRRASDAVAEFFVFGFAMIFMAKFFALLLIPLGLILVAIPVLTFAWLPTSKESKKFIAAAFVTAAFTEVWAYFLFQIVHKARFGHAFVFFSS